MTKLPRNRRGPRESGQAMVLVAICAALLALIAPIIVTQTIASLNTASQSVVFEDALAAAQAGVQQYRNYLDVTSNYWECSYQPASNPTPRADCGNDALDIAVPGCPNTQSPTCGWFVMKTPAGAPSEAFHYFPDNCFQQDNSCGGGSGTAALLLTVTGRAGSPGSYVYRTIQTTLQSTGILSNSYFSDYEVLDLGQNTTPVTVTTYSEIGGEKTTSLSRTVTGTFAGVVAGDTVDDHLSGVFPGGTTVTAVGSGSPPTSITVSNAALVTRAGLTIEFGAVADDTMQSAPTVPVPTSNGTANVQLWGALCQYRTYQPNAFIDSLPSGPDASANEIQNGVQGTGYYTTSPASQQYFGPWRGGSPSGQPAATDVFDYAYGTYPDNSPTETLSVEGACGGPYQFESNETFNGPVYTEDQLWMCGNPDFEFGLQSSVPPRSQLPAGYSSWPTYEGGSRVGWIDNENLDWDGSCGFTAGSNPTFGVAPQAGGSETLPPVNGALATDALNGGCYFTGPTIIEFVQGGSYDVWSPLSGVAGAEPVGSTSECGTWPSTGVQNVTLPSTGGLVVYVGNTPGTVAQQCPTCIATALSTGKALGAVPSDAHCPDPWLPYASPCPTLPNGDVIVEGELKGQVTIGAGGGINVSRDVSYQCADGGGVAAQASGGYAGFPSSCTQTEADILGLVAQGDVVLNHPGATSESNDDDVPFQTEPGEWPTSGWCPSSQDGTEITPTTPAATAIADAVPDCDVDNPVIDAAVVAVTGAFADEDWDLTQNPGSEGAWLYGTDISDYRGPFGCSLVPRFCPTTTTGYSKDFTYDSRLTFLTPPDLLQIASLLWNPEGFANCGSVDDNTTAFESPSDPFCPGLLKLNS